MLSLMLAELTNSHGPTKAFPAVVLYMRLDDTPGPLKTGIPVSCIDPTDVVVTDDDAGPGSVSPNGVTYVTLYEYVELGVMLPLVDVTFDNVGADEGVVTV